MASRERPLRICLLSYMGNMYSGGQGVYLYYLSRELVRLGHEVHVIAGPPYPELEPGIQLHRVESYNFFLEPMPRLLSYRNPLRIFQPLNFYEFALTKAGMFPLMFAFSFRAFQKLRELSRRYRFDLVHDNQTLGYGLLLVQAAGLPVVATIHHPLAIDRREALLQAGGPREALRSLLFYPMVMQEVVAPRMDRVITVSHCAAAAIRAAFHVPPEKLRVIYNGVDTETFHPRPQVGRLPGRILHVANTEDRKKGTRYLLEAAARLHREGCDFQLVIVDRRAEDLDLVPRLVRQLGLDGRVQLTGRLDRQELGRLYASAEVAVSPSTYEGFGFPAAEAMAAGTPVVATTAGAFPEFIEHGRSGWLVPPADAASLAAALRRLQEDPDLRRRLAEEGRRAILPRFSWRRAAEETVAVYREALGQPPVVNRAPPQGGPAG